MKAQFMKDILYNIIFLNFVFSVLERRNLYLTFKFKLSVVLYIFTVTMSIPLNMLTII